MHICLCIYIIERNTFMCIYMCLYIHIQNTKKNTYFVRVLAYFLSFKKYIYFSWFLLTSLPIHNYILSPSQKQNKQKSKQTKKAVRQKKQKLHKNKKGNWFDVNKFLLGMGPALENTNTF